MSFASQTPLVGSMIAGKYRLIRRLGVGGMGDVYLARVEGLAGFEKHVAVKLLHEHLVGEEMVMEHSKRLGAHTIESLQEIAGDVSPADFPRD